MGKDVGDRSGLQHDRQSLLGMSSRLSGAAEKGKRTGVDFWGFVSGGLGALGGETERAFQHFLSIIL